MVLGGNQWTVQWLLALLLWVDCHPGIASGCKEIRASGARGSPSVMVDTGLVVTSLPVAFGSLASSLCCDVICLATDRWLLSFPRIFSRSSTLPAQIAENVRQESSLRFCAHSCIVSADMKFSQQRGLPLRKYFILGCIWRGLDLDL